MNAANDDYRRKGINNGSSDTYEDHFLPKKSGLIFPAYFRKTYSPLFIVKQSASQNNYLRRVSR